MGEVFLVREMGGKLAGKGVSGEGSGGTDNCKPVGEISTLAIRKV